MPKHVTLLPHLSTDDLEHRYRGAQSTGYSPYWIGQLAKRYNMEGPAGMRNRARTESYRCPPLLDAAL